MTQSSHREQFDLKCRLIEKSIEAYILALETINRLTVQYRLEAFCFLFCNAWELMLKAKIIVDSGTEHSLYDKKRQGKPKRTISLRHCLKKIFPNDIDPLRRNVERIEELRDESVHLVISEIPTEVMSLFQAGVINYHRCLNSWFGQSLSEMYPVGMMSIVYDKSPEKSDIGDSRLQRRLGPDAAFFLSRFCKEIGKEFDQLQRPSQFSIPIDYHLVLTNRLEEGDIVLSPGSDSGVPAQVVETPKDSFTTHPHRQKEVIIEARDAFGMEINSTTYNVSIRYSEQKVGGNTSIKGGCLDRRDNIAKHL